MFSITLCTLYIRTKLYDQSQRKTTFKPKGSKRFNDVDLDEDQSNSSTPIPTKGNRRSNLSEYAVSIQYNFHQLQSQVLMKTTKR